MTFKHFFASALLTFFCSSSYASSIEVVGMGMSTQFYHQFINSDMEKNPPMPKLYIYDNNNSAYLAEEELYQLLKIVDEKDKDNFKTFYGRETPDKPIDLSAMQGYEILKNKVQARYIALYFNLPVDAYGAITSYQPSFIDDNQKLLTVIAERGDVLMFSAFD
jgi:hypothetical protein